MTNSTLIIADMLPSELLLSIRCSIDNDNINDIDNGLLVYINTSNTLYSSVFIHYFNIQVNMKD